MTCDIYCFFVNYDQVRRCIITHLEFTTIDFNKHKMYLPLYCNGIKK